MLYSKSNTKNYQFETSVFILQLLCVYNTIAGGEWTNYNTDNSGLSDNRVNSICIDNNGTIWFGTENGLDNFDGENWKISTTDNGLPSNTINHITYFKDSNKNRILLASENGSALLQIDSLNDVSVLSIYDANNGGLVDNSVITNMVDYLGVVWFGTINGLSSLFNSIWHSYTKDDYLSGNYILSISEDSSSGWKYIGTKGGGVSRLMFDEVDGISSASPYDEWSNLPSKYIYSIYIDENGNQWFGTDKGVALHTSFETRADWEVFTEDDGLINNFVKAIIKDENDLLWFGTHGGLSSFDGINWNSFTIDNGLIDNTINAIAVDSSGTLWIATENGVSSYKTITNVATGSNIKLNKNFIVLQGYPNPFNPEINLQYEFKKISNVLIEIYSIKGELVNTLIQGNKSPGIYTTQWGATNKYSKIVSSGIYLAHLIISNEDGTFASTKKIVKLK